MRFSPNGRYVLAGSLDGRLRLWDYLQGRPLKTYSGHANLSLCCASAFHAPACAVESAAAAAAAGDGGGDALMASAGSSSAEAAPAPAPRIVAGAEDGRVHLWGVNSRAELGAFAAAAAAGEPILGLDSHPLEDALVTGAGGDGGAAACAVRLWLPQA